MGVNCPLDKITNQIRFMRYERTYFINVAGLSEYYITLGIMQIADVYTFTPLDKTYALIIAVSKTVKHKNIATDYLTKSVFISY